MKKKTKYTDYQLGEVEIMEDFLPKPEELILKEETIKVTLNLSKFSVEYFKKLAGKNNNQYQKVIRKLLDSYVRRHPR